MRLEEKRPRILRVNIGDTLEYGDRVEVRHNDEVVGTFVCHHDDSRAVLRLKLKPIEPLTYDKDGNI